MIEERLLQTDCLFIMMLSMYILIRVSAQTLFRRVHLPVLTRVGMIFPASLDTKQAGN